MLASTSSVADANKYYYVAYLGGPEAFLVCVLAKSKTILLLEIPFGMSRDHNMFSRPLWANVEVFLLKHYLFGSSTLSSSLANPKPYCFLASSFTLKV